MKLYKFIVPMLMLGSVVGFTSCNSEEDDIFGASAAERLDEYKTLYAKTLTENGGRWLMEYFPNEEERGYVFVMTFNADGSVKIEGQNVWINNQYQSDLSLWQIVSDNGPVLSFNTYNSVFHIFSTPENLVGPEAPFNPDNNNKDVNETGEGHAGDYEFMVIGVSDDGNTMHLSGKKRLYDIYMHRLDNDVDHQALLASYYKASQSTFSTMFPDLVITDTKTGEQFALTQGSKGLFDAWPLAGDPVVQTVTMNALIGPDAVRFRKPFAIERADESDSIVVEKFVKQADGTYLCTDNDQNLVLDNCGYGNIFVGKSYKWKLNSVAKVGGSFADAYDKIASETQKNLKRTFRGLIWQYVNSDKTYVLQFDMSGNSAAAYIYGDQNVVNDGSAVKFNISTTDGNTNGKNRLSKIPALVEFIQLVNATDFEIESDNRFAPSSMKFTDKNNPANYMIFSL